MPIIGNPLNSVAFLTDSFNGNASTTAFTLSAAPAGSSSILVAISGVVQAPATYGVVGTTLTFSTAPPVGTASIIVRYLGIPASGVTTTAYRTLTEFTATASQTTFTPPSYTVGFIAVYQNGVMLGSTDYTATNGTTVVLAVGALVGDLISTESFYVSSVLNALPVTGGTISGNLVVTGTETVGTIISPAALTLQTNNGTTAITVDTIQNVGIGTTSPNTKLVVGSLATGTIDSTYKGNLKIEGTETTLESQGGIEFKTTTDGYGAKIQTLSGGGTNLVFANRNASATWTERMRIDSSGNVGIGTSTFAFANRLVVKQSADNSAAGLGARIERNANDSSLFLGYRTNSDSWQINASYSSTGAFKPITFHTSDTEAMRIDSSGRVTTPYQPAFRVGRSTSQVITSGQAVLFNIASGSVSHFNIGNHYNSATGIFTAPIGGRYFFSSCLIYESVPNNTDMTDLFYITVNGGNSCYSFRRSVYVSATTGTGGYFTDHANVILNLAASDQIAISVSRSGTVHANANYSWFAGYLLG